MTFQTMVGLALAALALGGCAQQETAAPPPPPSKPVSSLPPPSPQTIARAKAAHQSVLDAQSAYWRAHGQGLNEAPPAATKSKKSEDQTPK